MSGEDEVAPRWVSSGPHRIASAEIDEWVSVAGRGVALFAQYPVSSPRRPLPVVVLCHGLGGDHRGYAGLGAWLAAHGYAVLHPQFLDSLAVAGPSLGLVGFDDRTWMSSPRARELMHTMLFDPQHWVSRVARVHAVIDSLSVQRHIPARLRADGVIVAGHSFGAYTAQLVLGTRLFGVGLDDERFDHPSVVGGVLLSPQGSGDRGLTSHSWDAVELPLLVVTATNDRGPHGEGLSWRREVFDSAPSRLKYLAVVRGGDHLLGGVHLADDEDEQVTDPRVRTAVSAVAAAFVDRVHGDAAAGRWLASGPFPSILEQEHRESVQ